LVFKKLVVLICVLLLIPLGLALGCGESAREPAVDLEKVSEFEGGRLYKAGKIYVAQLNGNYKEMGRQYGELMKTQIEQFYTEAIEENFPKSENFTRAEAEQYSDLLYERYPERIRKIFDGMVETSGMDLDQLKLVDQYVVFLASSMAPPLCSCIAAWGEYTDGGPLVLGRNFDYPEIMKEFADTLTVVVFNSDDGSRSTATLGYAGQVGTLNAFNDAGLILEINDGMLCGDMEYPDDRTSSLINNVCFMLDSSNFETLDVYLLSTRLSYPFIINVADKNKACSYEDSTTKCTRREAQQDGLLVATNHFIDPSWAVPAEWQATEFWQIMVQNSQQRRDNLIALAEKNKGQIDASVIEDILDTTMENGGATVDATIYQFVAVPAELGLYVKAPGYQDWVLVDLGELFDQSGSE